MPDLTLPLSEASAERAFADLLDGRLSQAEEISFLATLAFRGETVVEIVAATRALRERMVRVRAPEGAIDVCGTGGDGLHTLNISTAVALVVAAAGVPVAKHGNRAASSKAGAADTLEVLGLNLDRAAVSAEATLGQLGIGFLFAQNFHPVLSRLAPVRRQIGRRTILNIVGPLCNPASVSRQLIGVARTDYLRIVATVCSKLGTHAAAVVGGAEGIDELSIAGPSAIAWVGALAGRKTTVLPLEAGLRLHPLHKIRGGDARYNARALLDLLKGTPGPYRDAVLLNAACALIVAGAADDWFSACAAAAESIDSRSASLLLNRWIAATNGHLS